MGTYASAEKIETQTDLWTCSLLVLIYSATLVRVCIGTRDAWLIQLIMMLLVGNICTLAFWWTLQFLRSGDINRDSAIIYLCTLNGVWMLCFNLAHWMFAFSYYKISRIRSFTLDNKNVPETIIKFDQNTNRVLFSLNIIVPLLFGISDYIYERNTAS
jgi:hypothetical protein